MARVIAEPAGSRRSVRVVALAAALLLGAGGVAPAPVADRKYLEDYDFLVDTVRKEGAAVACKHLDWDALVKPMKARFEKCTNDLDHVKNVMALLALLEDSHTGDVESKVDPKKLPTKFEGLCGGGLWFGWEGGRFALRGIMEGHALATTLPLGSVLLSVGGDPAWYALARERRRVAAFQGISSDHSFFASLGNALLPFGEQQRMIAIEVVMPDGPGDKVKRFDVARAGPNGKNFDPGSDLLPEGIAWKEGATAGFLAAGSLPATLGGAKDGAKVGYLHITGGMNAATVKAFDAAFDSLKGMDALLLDCRGMGGGGDENAWTMCGRLFSKGADNGRNGRIAPSGSWQFDGPVVMLQDETEVSSAETFTWALSETGRVLSVGRPTGGWGLIPKRFDLPSGLASFRLGVSDRATPIRNVHTEGVGWPPDLVVPFGPKLVDFGGGKIPDPVRALGLEILGLLRAGVATIDTRAAFHALGEGDLATFRAFAKKASATAKSFEGEKLAKLFADDLAGELALEMAAIDAASDARPPDALGLNRRLPRLLARAKAAGLSDKAAALEAAAKKLAPEAAAQEALFRAVDDAFNFTDKSREAFFTKHGTTRTAKYIRAKLTK